MASRALLFPRPDADLDDAVAASLRHAARAPFYRKVAEKLRRARGVADLAALPLVDKPTAAKHQERFVVAGVPGAGPSLDAGIVSSATTREGRPLRVLRSPEEADPFEERDAGEQRSVDDEGRAGGRGQGRRQDRGPGGRTLELFSPRHGVRSTGGTDRVLLPATLHPNTVDVLVDLLERRADLDTLVAPLSTLKWITVALGERGCDPAALGVKAIGTTGYPLTEAARRWLAAAWDAPLFDNYSLSELPGFALECGACGALHWHGRGVVGELVDPATLSPARGDLGELVVTTLVPFVKRMPLVRYRTGDVVERRGRCSATGLPGFVVRGRLPHSLVDVSGKRVRYAVLSRDLTEVAEAEPLVALHPHPAERLGYVPSADLGVPKVVVDAGAWEVRIEVRFDPARHPERAAQLAVSLTDRVIGGGLPQGRRPALRLVRPGSLDVSRAAWKL